MTDPRHVHLIAAKHILRYLRGTVDYGIKYEVNQNINLEGYVDLDWEGNSIDRKSTSWCSRKQSCVALSTTKEKDVSSCYLGGSMFLLKTTCCSCNIFPKFKKNWDPPFA